MKSFLDFEEKNVEKAVQKACEELKVSRDKLKYDIISHGSSGIFGLVGAKKALIRVFMPDLSTKQLQSEIFEAQSKSTAAIEKPAPSDACSLHTDVAALVDEAFGQMDAPVSDKKAEPAAVPSPKKPKPIAIKHPPRPPRSSHPSSRNGKSKHFQEKKGADKEKPHLPPVDHQISETSALSQTAIIPSKTPVPVAEIEPLAGLSNHSESATNIATTLTQKILTALAVEAELSIENTQDVCRINVKTADPGVLIGKKGQTLDAIQYLLDKIISKQCGKGKHIVFDVEGYVESRKSELADLATKLASKTMKTGKPSTMTRMNAHDRRIVHVCLKGNPLVRTQSVGDGYYRKLIIFPKKKTTKPSAGDTSQNE